MRITAAEYREQFTPSASKGRGTHARQKVKAARGQGHEHGKMNKTEAAYAEHLELLRRKGEIVHYEFEPFKLRLADRTYYNFDFLVITADLTIEIHEVKGHWEDDARVKWKVGADEFWYFTFKAIKNKSGGWEVEMYR